MKIKIYYSFIIGALAVLLSSFNYVSALKNGIWLAKLKTTSGNYIPFNFELKDSAGKKLMTIINGKERFKVTDITVKGDSVLIKMPLFDSEIRAALSSGFLRGNWVRHLGNRNVLVPFSAEPDVSWRFFSSPAKPKYTISGRWSATFTDEDLQNKDVTVGEFKQTGNDITGTFLTTTGDYRFLQGTVSGDELYLSCFDGSHAFLFTGKISNSQTITNGKFYSGASSVQLWNAVKNENAKLPDAYSLTVLKPGYKKIDFTFPDLNKKPVSLTDDQFKNKVVILQIMGSWCPNCMDETAYLVDFYKKYHVKGVAVLGLAYERTTDFATSKKNIEQLKNRFNVPYDLLVTGYTNNKNEAAKSLPALSGIVGFPTTIIIDKKGDVRKIHTGFSGPGTGDHYTEFTHEFETLINQLLAEK
ncbi:peroxiredoxin family protein [Mucilaginibacter arboris]|uniref:Redoxin family protein n=1 Tax=Mucilaginibacter arboris TaxID=2682090 RepID=A0A7K1SW59_9SPHI|nr:TlpA disulfide reductase family protein [Mucilaginibacter arboris]MVN21300.1 redoxin family protein [Mucilaginibacter arboris]